MAAIVKLFRYKIRIRVPGDTIDTRTIPNLGPSRISTTIMSINRIYLEV